MRRIRCAGLMPDGKHQLNWRAQLPIRREAGFSNVVAHRNLHVTRNLPLPAASAFARSWCNSDAPRALGCGTFSELSLPIRRQTTDMFPKRGGDAPRSTWMAQRKIDPAELARISGAMLNALAEARALSEAGETGDDLRRLVRHAREMHDLLLENLIAAEPSTAQYARGLADSMANHLDEMERLIDVGQSDSPGPAVRSH